MICDPLSKPSKSSPILEQFSRSYKIDPKGSSLDRLNAVVQNFVNLPYENLTKIIKESNHHGSSHTKRGPDEVLKDHFKYGTGGTCFSLTAALLYLVRSLGFHAKPILADRHYGENTHCALVVEIEGKLQLLDPGYLILKPLEISRENEQSIKTSFNQLLLKPHRDAEKLDLYTVWGKSKTYRLTFKTEPVDRTAFLKAWDDSFEWDMMRYPLLTKIAYNQQIYLNKTRLQKRTAQTVDKEEIDHSILEEYISKYFKIDRFIVKRALSILRRRGDING